MNGSRHDDSFLVLSSLSTIESYQRLDGGCVPTLVDSSE